MRSLRIGIDVGGTFTDAVALDDETHELIGQVKTPTTHDAAEGVAHGILIALRELMAACEITPEEVRFIAHGTTQATNALLEGDVERVGIIATGSGVEGLRARSETVISDVELAPGRFLRTTTRFLDSASLTSGLPATMEGLRKWGAGVIVAAAPFSVDNPAQELEIMEDARHTGLPAVGTHELTKLYGLRMRTRTAVVNASILPRMVDTADKTSASVRESGIIAPLMVMKCDGGVMTAAEVRRRPILTVLSGPAAGVAGALLYERVSRGIFLEVGGTSTDLSAVRDGRVMVDYAEIGGHKTYVTSLDVRTVGIGGGSMIRFDSATRRIIGVGPRSAHIAGLEYSAYTDLSDLSALSMELFSPREGDPADYVCVRNAAGKSIALTMACAANVLGNTKPGDYAFGNPDAARAAFAPLADAIGETVDDTARTVLRLAAVKIEPVVNALLKQYGLDKAGSTLIGGGGGAGAVVRYLAEHLGMTGRLARSHEVISPIGVALAMVREVVERTIVSPSAGDLLRVRKEAEEAALHSGASASTIEVTVEVDSALNRVRATATGATAMQSHDVVRTDLSEAELRAMAARDMGGGPAVLAAHAGRWYVYFADKVQKKFIWTQTRRLWRVVNAEGVISLARENVQLSESWAAEWAVTLDVMLREHTHYGDGGAMLPETYLLACSRLINLSGGVNRDQMHVLAEAELGGLRPEEPIVILCIERT